MAPDRRSDGRELEAEFTAWLLHQTNDSGGGGEGIAQSRALCSNNETRLDGGQTAASRGWKEARKEGREKKGGSLEG